MRIIIVVVFLITGCCLAQDRVSLSQAELIETTETTGPDKNEETGPTQVNVLELFGFSQESMETPDPVPIEKFPDVDTYPITVRVVIEGQPVVIEDEESSLESIWWSRKIKDVQRDLKNTEDLFSDLGIKFIVNEISFKEFDPDVISHFINANQRRGIITIVYMLPNGFEWDGYSSAPWESVNRGIVINYAADEWTLAHEIGHYFGLLHTFMPGENGDFVEDTLDQNCKFCAGPENSTTNCRNIMNYCDHGPKTVTKDQLERFKRFLRANRLNHITRNKTDILLRGHKFPVPANGVEVIIKK